MLSNLVAFDPIQLAKKTEKKVIRGNEKKYNGFRLEHYYGQIATARGCGCNLRCVFCWINPSRDFPENYGIFYSPEEVYEKTKKISSSKFGEWAMTTYVRISGGEPTLGQAHLLGLIELCAKSKKEFLLETNGILLGDDESYVRELSKFKKYFWVRLSLKAGTPEAFEKKTGAKSDFFELPFVALKLLEKYKINYRIASMSKNPEIMPYYERYSLFKKLIEAGAGHKLLLLEEEKIDLFDSAKKRLAKLGLIKNLTDLNKKHYTSLDFLFEKWLTKHAHIATLDELILQLDRISKMSPSVLISILDQLDFSITVDSPCATCRANNPWHGHGGVQDDLNEDKLGKFIH